VEHLSTEALEAGLDEIRNAPSDLGRIELIVRRPGVEERELVEQATLDGDDGLVGDNWRVRGSSRTPDGRSNPEAQIYVDFDISEENLPAGTRLALGSAVLEVSAHPHTGCDKFSARFGRDAMRFVNSPVGRSLRLRGMNTKVVVGGVIAVGDNVTKVTS
jgi:hypothetical protein